MRGVLLFFFLAFAVIAFFAGVFFSVKGLWIDAGIGFGVYAAAIAFAVWLATRP